MLCSCVCRRRLFACETHMAFREWVRLPQSLSLCLFFAYFIRFSLFSPFCLPCHLSCAPLYVWWSGTRFSMLFFPPCLYPSEYDFDFNYLIFAVASPLALGFAWIIREEASSLTAAPSVSCRAQSLEIQRSVAHPLATSSISAWLVI